MDAERTAREQTGTEAQEHDPDLRTRRHGRDDGEDASTAARPILATSQEPSEADKARGPMDCSDDPDARLYTTAPLEAEDGTTYVIQQQNVGPDNELGGGEWPDPETPPRSPASGAA
jgi:hypothetical protein